MQPVRLLIGDHDYRADPQMVLDLADRWAPSLPKGLRFAIRGVLMLGFDFMGIDFNPPKGSDYLHEAVAFILAQFAQATWNDRVSMVVQEATDADGTRYDDIVAVVIATPAVDGQNSQPLALTAEGLASAPVRTIP